MLGLDESVISFRPGRGDSFDVYSGELVIGTLVKGASYAFFTERNSFSAVEIIKIAEKLKRINSYS